MSDVSVESKLKEMVAFFTADLRSACEDSSGDRLVSSSMVLTLLDEAVEGLVPTLMDELNLPDAA